MLSKSGKIKPLSFLPLRLISVLFRDRSQNLKLL